MSSNKEITLSARLDDAQLVQDFARVQQKVRQLMDQEQRQAQGMKINQNLVNNGMPAMGQYSGQAYQNAYNKNNSAMRQIYAQEVEQLSRMEKIRDSLTKKLERQTKLQQEMLAQGKEIAAIEESRALTAERLGRASQGVSRQQALLNGSGKLLRPDMGGGEAMGPPEPPSGGLSGMGLLGKAASALGGAVLMRYVEQAAQDYIRRPIDITRAQGSAVAGTTGRTLSQMQSGDFAYEGMFGDQREKAAQSAQTAEGRGRKWDMGVALTGAGLMAGGLLATATGVGAVPGLAAAGVGAGMLFNKRNAVFDRDKYNAEKAAQYSEDFNSALQSQKDMAPFKQDAIEKLKKNGPSYLASQRSMGMSDKDLFGYMQNMGYSGFTDQQGLQASSSILGAGGSTAMARNSDFALKAERGLGVTNAPQLLGMLSGSQGIPETSKKTLIDIFAQGQSIGLDNSKYAEENRKFMQNVAESISKTGVKSEDAGESIAKMMANFTAGDKTMRGLQAGKSAYEAYQGTTSTTSGYQGAINASILLGSDKRFGKLKDPASIQYLMGLQADELDPSSPTIRDLAQQSGMTPSELVNTVRQSKADAGGKGLFRAKEFSNLKQMLKSYADTHGGSIGGFTEQKDLSIPGLAAMQSQSGIKGDIESRQYVIGAAAESLGYQNSDLGQLKKKASMAAETKDTGRSMDTILQASAINAQTSLQTLSESINKFASDAISSAARMRDVLVPAAKSADANLQASQNEADAAAVKANNYKNFTDFRDAAFSKSESDIKRSKMQETATAANKALTNR